MDGSEQLFEGRRFRVIRKTVKSPAGRTLTCESIEHPGAVVILPLVGDDAVCLIKSFRPAVGETLLELPAGTLEPGENPALAAERELAEETGYKAARWRKACEFWVSPGILRERMHLFVAEDLRPGPSAHEAGEEIEPFVLSWEACVAAIDRGEIQDAKTLVGLYFGWRERLLS